MPGDEVPVRGPEGKATDDAVSAQDLHCPNVAGEVLKNAHKADTQTAVRTFIVRIAPGSRNRNAAGERRTRQSLPVLIIRVHPLLLIRSKPDKSYRF